MLAVAVRHARGRGLHEIRAEYSPTSKNRPCLEFLRSSGLDEDDAMGGDVITFRWPCDSAYPLPRQIRLVGGGESPETVIEPAWVGRGVG